MDPLKIQKKTFLLFPASAHGAVGSMGGIPTWPTVAHPQLGLLLNCTYASSGALVLSRIPVRNSFDDTKPEDGKAWARIGFTWLSCLSALSFPHGGRHGCRQDTLP